MSKLLLVIDMQNDFVTGSLNNPFAQDIQKSIADKILTYEGEVLATRDTHSGTYLTTQEGKFLPIKHCIYKTDGWELVPEISEAVSKRNGYIFDKFTFGSVDLIPYITKHYDSLSEIELCGTCTSICVVSNALILKAAFPEVKIIVDAKNCACISEASHKAALEVMKNCQIIIKE